MVVPDCILLFCGPTVAKTNGKRSTVRDFIAVSCCSISRFAHVISVNCVATSLTLPLCVLISTVGLRSTFAVGISVASVNTSRSLSEFAGNFIFSNVFGFLIKF